MKRAFNFNAGPAALPKEVLQKAQAELLDYRGTGMSVLELSHRGQDYDDIHNEAQKLLRRLLVIPENYQILFLQGGASQQFLMVPLNFLATGQTANYILTGSWSEKALAEAGCFGKTKIGGTSRDKKYSYIPNVADLDIESSERYVHLTSNNTIYGTQWREFPSTEVPLIADMSSDILSREITVSEFALIYAGAQKNLGPAGVTVVIIRDDLLEQVAAEAPIMLNYRLHAEKNSLYNTPPTFGIYLLGLVLAWVEELGGVAFIERQNKLKAEILYDIIDQSGGFYRGHAEKDSRSLMNVTFNLASEELEKEFLAQAKTEGFVGLSGHRSIGGCRASIYNAVPVQACKALGDFMQKFQNEHQ